MSNSKACLEIRSSRDIFLWGNAQGPEAHSPAQSGCLWNRLDETHSCSRRVAWHFRISKIFHEIYSDPVPGFRKHLPRLPPVPALWVLNGNGPAGRGSVWGWTPAHMARSLSRIGATLSSQLRTRENTWETVVQPLFFLSLTNPRWLGLSLGASPRTVLFLVS